MNLEWFFCPQYYCTHNIYIVYCNILYALYQNFYFREQGLTFYYWQGQCVQLIEEDMLAHVETHYLYLHSESSNFWNYCQGWSDGASPDRWRDEGVGGRWSRI